MVRTTHQLSGTHLGNLDMTEMGMGVIPPSGKSFSVALQQAEVIVRNGKILSYHVKPNDGAGLMVILEAIDVPVPQM